MYTNSSVGFNASFKNRIKKWERLHFIDILAWDTFFNTLSPRVLLIKYVAARLTVTIAGIRFGSILKAGTSTNSAFKRSVALSASPFRFKAF